MDEKNGKTTAPKKRKPWPLVAWLAVAAVLALLLSLFVVRVGFVNGSSMEQSLKAGQLVLIWQPGYRPQRGDVVVTSRQNPFGHSLTKRVIATEGQTLEIRGGQVWVDGQLLEEPYLPAGAVTEPELCLTLPTGTCFLMGDNRTASKDSREIGPVVYEEIVGKVVWPNR